jgi:hypothetical protein
VHVLPAPAAERIGGHPIWLRVMDAVGCDPSGASFWVGAAIGLATGLVLPRLLALAVDAWAAIAHGHGA